MSEGPVFLRGAVTTESLSWIVRWVMHSNRYGNALSFLRDACSWLIARHSHGRDVGTEDIDYVVSLLIEHGCILHNATSHPQTYVMCIGDGSKHERVLLARMAVLGLIDLAIIEGPAYAPANGLLGRNVFNRRDAPGKGKGK